MQSSDRPSQPQTAQKTWQIATIVAIIAAIVVNAISNIFPVGGQNVGQIANGILAPVQITPANYAFAIWGLIYIGLIAFAVFQAGAGQREQPRLVQSRAPIVWASVFQMAWIYLFEARYFWLSVVVMFGILLSLLRPYLVWNTADRVSRRENWFARLPISVYTGWISVASIVNVASALFISGWDGFGIAPTTWTVIMMAIAAVIGTTLAIRFRDPAFPSVVVWALVAIAIRQSANQILVVTAISFAIAVALVILFTQFRFGQKLR